MPKQKAPFHFGLFDNALQNLIGRKAEKSHRFGWDGYYSYRFEAQNEVDKKKFAECEHIIQEWLLLFDIIPLRSHCVYGLLPQPEDGQENKIYLRIVIAVEVEEREKKLI